VSIFSSIDEDGHHIVQSQKRSNTPIFTKREVVLADMALSSQYGTKSSRVVMTVTNIEDKFRCFNQNVYFWYQIQIWMYHSAANRPEEMIAVMKLRQFSWNHSKYRNEYIPGSNFSQLTASAYVISGLLAGRSPGFRSELCCFSHLFLYGNVMFLSCFVCFDFSHHTNPCDDV
jgi:hypothetical protein